jgi:23S rRNA pseudouridine2605 synthase
VNLKKYDKKTDKSIVELIIHEGRNHQVRKMFEVIGHDVLKLKREKYANLDLTNLKPGEYRKLTNKEIAILYSLIKK